jgi:hypothetical protein
MSDDFKEMNRRIREARTDARFFAVLAVFCCACFVAVLWYLFHTAMIYDDPLWLEDSAIKFSLHLLAFFLIGTKTGMMSWDYYAKAKGLEEKLEKMHDQARKEIRF